MNCFHWHHPIPYLNPTLRYDGAGLPVSGLPPVSADCLPPLPVSPFTSLCSFATVCCNPLTLVTASYPIAKYSLAIVEQLLLRPSHTCKLMSNYCSGGKTSYAPNHSLLLQWLLCFAYPRYVGHSRLREELMVLAA